MKFTAEREISNCLVDLCAAIADEGVIRWVTPINKQVQIMVTTNISVAPGISHREGVGKVRYLEVKPPWLQQLVKQKLFRIGTVAGKHNPTNLGTKVLGPADRKEGCKLAGIVDITNYGKIEVKTS